MRVSLALIALCANLCAAAVVIQNVTIVDVGVGTVRPHLTAVIEGDRIVAVGPQGSIKTPSNARIVDGTGQYLSPGLWDMRVQLRNPGR
jgi:dihydroorotase-like cyclic amidohydrolase